jgi:hypothetical protein
MLCLEQGSKKGEEVIYMSSLNPLDWLALLIRAGVTVITRWIATHTKWVIVRILNRIPQRRRKRSARKA